MFTDELTFCFSKEANEFIYIILCLLIEIPNYILSEVDFVFSVSFNVSSNSLDLKRVLHIGKTKSVFVCFFSLAFVFTYVLFLKLRIWSHPAYIVMLFKLISLIS